ncbi:Methylmalonyl-CoA decarboxylase [Azospirillaceae bacterium]
MQSPVSFEVDEDGVATLTLNDLARRNALSRDLVGAAIAALDQAERQKRRVVILRAAPGVSIWSSGHDVGELPRAGKDPVEWDDPLRAFVRRIKSLSCPVLALLEGGVWGGGCEVVFACDVIFAAPNVTFAVTPAKLGIPYHITGFPTFMNAMPRKMLNEMLFVGVPIAAERVLSLGMIAAVVPFDRIEAVVLSCARRVVSLAPMAVTALKVGVTTLADVDGAAAPADLEMLEEARRRVFSSPDCYEGLAALQARRPAVFQGREVS